MAPEFSSLHADSEDSRAEPPGRDTLPVRRPRTKKESPAPRDPSAAELGLALSIGRLRRCGEELPGLPGWEGFPGALEAALARIVVILQRGKRGEGLPGARLQRRLRPGGRDAPGNRATLHD